METFEASIFLCTAFACGIVFAVVGYVWAQSIIDQEMEEK